MNEERLQEIKDSIKKQYEIIGDNENLKEAKFLTDEEQELVEEIERLNSIIKEVRGYIENRKEDNKSCSVCSVITDELLEILDKE